MRNNQLINDLKWVISSPPLIVMSTPNCEWYNSDFYQNLYLSSNHWFRSVEKDSKYIENLISFQKDKRLGQYFETLWQCWIEASERFDIIERNLQIVEKGKTLGELDLIVMDHLTGKMLHWELAVKFYLGMGDTHLHKNWFGPAKKDRLDLKLNHLVNHQTKLCQLEATKKILASKNICVEGSAVIIKGRLFYPTDQKTNAVPVYASDNHCRSRWLKKHRVAKEFDDNTDFLPLIGSGWMGKIEKVELKNVMNLHQLLATFKHGTMRLPIMVSAIKHGVEHERVFIVEDDWDNVNLQP